MLAHINQALSEGKERIMLVGSSTSWSDEGGFMDSGSGFLADDDLAAVRNERVVVQAGGYQRYSNYPTGYTQVDVLGGGYFVSVICRMLCQVDWHVGITSQLVSGSGFYDLEFRFGYNNRGKLVKQGCMVVKYDSGEFRTERTITYTPDTDPFHQVNVRQITDYCRIGMRGSAQPFIGLLNNSTVRGQLKSNLNRFLNGMLNRGMLTAYQDLEVTATRDDEIAGVCYVKVLIQPVFILEFIEIIIKLG
jgi:hypothetical protein